MKRAYTIVATIILFLLTITSSYAIVEFPTKTDVPLNKDWRIKFNMNIDESTINEENIYILDSQGNRHDCEIPLPDLAGFNLIQIVPKTNYNSSEEYTLYIKGVKSTSGKGLKDEITMNFSTVNNSNEVINFPDENLEAVIREEINKPTGEIFKSDVKNIEILNGDGGDITSIDGLENLMNLTELDLRGNQISDISALGNLTDLTFLDLSRNNIIDISPLCNLTKLDLLDLRNNQISDISALKNLVNLNELYLSENPITDYSPTSAYYDNLEDKDFMRYEFDNIDKVPLNEYVTDGYIAEPMNVTEEDWLTDFAGGKDEQFIVKVGEIIFDNNEEDKEAYIELESEKDKITLVANGCRYEYYEETSMIRKKTINFLTGKKLVGSEVIKDYSNGKIKLVIEIEYDKEGTGTPLVMYCSNDDFEIQPQNNYYNLKVRD